MAEKGFSAVLAMIVAVAVWAAIATAQSDDCTNVLISMSPCLNYISGNSTTPSSACCTQLGTVVRSQPRCLCQVLDGGATNLGLSINQTQAMALPSACNVQTPPVSQCKTAGSPSGSPGSSTPNSPSGGSSDGGSKTVPSGDGTNTSDSASRRMSVSVMFLLVLLASYVLS